MEYELPEEKISIFNFHYKEAGKLSRGISLLKGAKKVKYGFWNKWKVKKATKHYQECLKLIPNHWQINWLIAKIYQATSENEIALKYFEVAIRIEKTNPDLPREASISAMDIGKVDLAVKYSLEAINRESNDSGLYCNHAINLMVLGEDSEALVYINKALQMNPYDGIHKNAFSLISDVSNGKRKRPKYNQLG